MNKVVVLMCAVLLSTNGFGSIFTKKLSLPTPKELLAGEKYEDFSGTWVGNCGEGEEKFTIQQTETKIQLKDHADPESDYHWYSINNIEAHSMNSSERQSLTVHDAIISGSTLFLVTSRFINSKVGSTWTSFTVNIFKNGDILIIDYAGSRQQCEFKRV
ncbi:TPA: hypothetical protein ACT7HE_003310 [Legionella pneumophila]